MTLAKEVSEPDDRYRPPVEDRWVDGMRTEAGQIKLRTRWLYSEPIPDAILPPGRTRHAFSRGGVVVSSDFPPHGDYDNDLAAHLHRAIAAFGDDQDLIIEVRLVGSNARAAAEERTSIATYIREEAEEIRSWAQGPLQAARADAWYEVAEEIEQQLDLRAADPSTVDDPVVCDTGRAPGACRGRLTGHSEP